MISEKMQEELNEQVNKEFYSAYMYLAMSAYCNTIGLPGFEHWMRMQYEEEIMHVTKMYDYIMGQGRAVHLKAIEEPRKNTVPRWKSSRKRWSMSSSLRR